MPNRDVSNRFERRAQMLTAAQRDRAERLARVTAEEPPADASKLTNDQVRQMWHQTATPMTPEDAARAWWMLHDATLAQETQNGTPIDQAHQKAEQAAMSTFPMRGKLAGLGVAELETAVKKAEALKKIAEPDAESPAEDANPRDQEG